MRHSIVVATYNRPDCLRRCLASLLAADHPDSSWEILVMDNSDEGFRQRNAAVVQGAQADRVRHIRMRSFGLMAARHEGVEVARGNLVSFIDEDVHVQASWFEGVYDAMLDADVELVTGPILPSYEVPPPQWVDSLWVESGSGRYHGYLALLDLGSAFSPISPTLVWGANFSFRRETFISVGGSNPDAFPPQWNLYRGNGETALAIRIGAASGNAIYEPRCGVRHSVPLSRLNVGYFEWRARCVGMEASYTALRREHGLGPKEGVPLVPNPTGTSWAQRARARLHPTRLGRTKRQVSSVFARKHAIPDDRLDIQNALHIARRDGYESHRAAAERDPVLMEWILRPNYLGVNGKPPLIAQAGRRPQPPSPSRGRRVPLPACRDEELA